MNNKKELAKQILINNGFIVDDKYGFRIERGFNLVEFTIESKTSYKEKIEHIIIGIATAGTNLYSADKIEQYMNDYNKVIKCYNELKENKCLEFDVKLGE